MQVKTLVRQLMDRQHVRHLPGEDLIVYANETWQQPGEFPHLSAATREIAYRADMAACEDVHLEGITRVGRHECQPVLARNDRPDAVVFFRQNAAKWAVAACGIGLLYAFHLARQQ